MEMSATLYSSNSEVKKVIKKYVKVLECDVCKAIYTELNSVGCWQCKYHPGRFDKRTQQWTCCGEKKHLYSNYDHFARYATWKDKFSPVPLFSSGCTPCDHKSTLSEIPYEDIDVENIAQLIPFMKPVLTDRNFIYVDSKPTLQRKKPLIP